MTMSSQRVGQLLKQLRRQRGITGAELGAKVGLSQSKISKIETGYYPVLHTAEVERILNILDTPKTIRQQITLALHGMHTQSIQGSFHSIRLAFKEPTYRRRVKQYRVFGMNIVPALLQIAPYRSAVLKTCGIPTDEINEWMKEMVTRQDLLWQKGLSFHFIVHESALYTVPATVAEQIEQLDRVERMAGMPNVALGIVPLQAGLTVAEHASFALHDDSRVFKTIGNGEIESTDEEDILLHARIFDELERLSAVGPEAKVLIRRAQDYFSAI